MNSIKKKSGLFLIILIIMVLSLYLFIDKKLNFSSQATVSIPSMQTSLEWYSSDYIKKTDWNTATTYCANLPTDTGIYRGVSWRLPTINELMSVHSSTSASTTPSFNNWFYWSGTESSTTISSTSMAYDLDMTPNIDFTPSLFSKNLPDDYARCVRNVTISAPDAPTNVYAQAGDGQATISFTLPTINEYSDVYYTVISDPENITVTGSSSPITVTGLTNGNAYTFTVTATNIAGTSTLSASSSEIMPQSFVFKRSNAGVSQDYCSGITGYNSYVTASSTFAGGDGSSGNPYQISNWSELNNMRDNLSANYILTTDLSSTTIGYSGVGNNWTPIGGCQNSFVGNFDGNGHTISGLYIHDWLLGYSSNEKNNSTASVLLALGGGGGGGTIVCPAWGCGGPPVILTPGGAGLFAVSSGNISNIGLLNVNMSNSSSHNVIGALVAYQKGGTIYNSYSTGVVSGYDEIGGLVGHQKSGTIEKSYSTANVAGHSNIGGLIGFQENGLVSRSYATGNINNNYTYGGGLIGYCNGSVMNSYATGNVGTGDVAGGLVGIGVCNISNSYSIGIPSGRYPGGLISNLLSAGTTTGSYWDTDRTGVLVSSGGIGTTTSAMKTASTYVGWDTATIWNIIDGSYPTLK